MRKLSPGNLISILSAFMIPAFMRPTKLNAETGKQEFVKPRFVAGDKFYNYMRYKRVDGKWRVKK